MGLVTVGTGTPTDVCHFQREIAAVPQMEPQVSQKTRDVLLEVAAGDVKDEAWLTSLDQSLLTHRRSSRDTSVT